MDKFGLIPGTNLPRLMDMGQCNDVLSAIKVAQALSHAFDTDINSLPLSIVMSWFEQKAVAVRPSSPFSFESCTPTGTHACTHACT